MGFLFVDSRQPAQQRQQDAHVLIAEALQDPPDTRKRLLTILSELTDARFRKRQQRHPTVGLRLRAQDHPVLLQPVRYMRQHRLGKPRLFAQLAGRHRVRLRMPFKIIHHMTDNEHIRHPRFLPLRRRHTRRFDKAMQCLHKFPDQLLFVYMHSLPRRLVQCVNSYYI